MDRYKIIVFQPYSESALGRGLADHFAVTKVTRIDDCLALAAGEEFKVVIVDMLACTTPDFSLCEELMKAEVISDLPLLLLCSWGELCHKLRAFELGCDDFIESDITLEETCARVNKAIYNRIANEQLKSRLQLANETANTAMSDISALDCSIQFLLDVNRCDNLDELGQLFFLVIERYRLSCSLQMRSLYGVKNMDASGLTRDLEAQLLDQMRGGGRYIEFGRRTIINCGQASLLIRNMPVERDKQYEFVKDNMLVLMQGVDTRIKSLDSRQTLLDEKKSLHKLSTDMQMVMHEIDASYRTVMRDIVTKVEDMAEAIQHRIPVLALSEEQEKFFEQVLHNCVMGTNQVFNRGLRVDECFQRLSAEMRSALDLAANMEEQLSAHYRPQASPHSLTIDH